MRNILSGLTIFLVISGFSCIVASEEMPDSVLKGKTEVFKINCPGNRQQSTMDVNECLGTQLSMLLAVQKKYIDVIRKELTKSEDTPPDYTKRLLSDFDAENKAWDTLIHKAVTATYTNYEAGTIRSIAAGNREIELTEFRIRNQWQNWLVGMAGPSEAALPAPEFEHDD